MIVKNVLRNAAFVILRAVVFVLMAVFLIIKEYATIDNNCIIISFMQGIQCQINISKLIVIISVRLNRQY